MQRHWVNVCNAGCKRSIFVGWPTAAMGRQFTLTLPSSLLPVIDPSKQLDDAVTGNSVISAPYGSDALELATTVNPFRFSGTSDFFSNFGALSQIGPEKELLIRLKQSSSLSVTGFSVSDIYFPISSE